MDIPPPWNPLLRISPCFVPLRSSHHLQISRHVHLRHPRHVRLHISPSSCLLHFICWPTRFHNCCPSRPRRIICHHYCCIQGVLFGQGTGRNLCVPSILVLDRMVKLTVPCIVDAVLLQQGHENLVSRGRQFTRSSGHKGVMKLGRSILKPLNRFSREGIVRYLVSLPLNAVPIVGTVLFLLYNGETTVFMTQILKMPTILLAGIKAGPSFHARYFQLKGLDKPARESFVETRKGPYTAFVPYFSPFSVQIHLTPVLHIFSTDSGQWLSHSTLSQLQASSSGSHPQ